MNAASFAKHNRTRSLFAHLYQQMRLITAQDTDTAQHLQRLGAPQVSVTGTFKAAAPPLICDEQALADLQHHLQNRFTWITAPAHQADVDIAVAAHKILRKQRPDALLIIAPRHPDRPLTITLPHTTRSQGDAPDAPVWLADTLGELGLLYRVAQAALIGGTFDDTEGHAAHLTTPKGTTHGKPQP